jgi:hypothetical protein
LLDSGFLSSQRHKGARRATVDGNGHFLGSVKGVLHHRDTEEHGGPRRTATATAGGTASATRLSVWRAVVAEVARDRRFFHHRDTEEHGGPRRTATAWRNCECHVRLCVARCRYAKKWQFSVALCASPCLCDKEPLPLPLPLSREQQAFRRALIWHRFHTVAPIDRHRMQHPTRALAAGTR